MLVPLGLDQAVQALSREEGFNQDNARELAGQLLLRLQEMLTRERKTYRVEACLDSPVWPREEALGESGLTSRFFPFQVESTGKILEPLFRQQLRTMGSLHTRAGGGTTHLLFPPEEAHSPEEIVSLLQFVWKHTRILRLRLERRTGLPRQPGLPWEEMGSQPENDPG